MNNKGFYWEMKKGLKDQLNQCKEINLTMSQTTDKLVDINKDSENYNTQLKTSTAQVKILKNKQKKEKQFFYFAVIFYFLCLAIIFIRRVPFILVIRIIKSMIDPFFQMIVSLLG
jgi:hypothetical protein